MTHEEASLIGPSLYFFNHVSADCWSLELSDVDEDSARHIDVLMQVPFSFTETQAFVIAGNVKVGFEGFTVVEDNLPEKPTSVSEAETLLRPFIGDLVVEGEDQRWRVVFTC